MKKNKTPLTQPLSERELAWLDSFLDNLSQTNGECMTLEAVDGLFCALIINPVMAKPAEWMNTIFGKKQAFTSDEDLEKVMMLLVRYWNHASTMIEKDNHYLPRVKESDEKGKAWASGFQIGMDYCQKEWEIFAKNETYSVFLAPFRALKQENGSAKDRLEFLEMIPAILHRLFHYWVEKSAQDKKETQPKVGRNDPCPCGSGKKYKKCCDS